MADTTLSNTQDDKTLTFITSTEGVPTLVHTSSAWEKCPITQDENLTIKQFGEVAPQMIPFFYDLRWDCPHIQMHIDFWGALKNHKWRNVRNKHQQCALLVYQGQQRHRWHDTIMLVRAFNLSLLNEELLRPTLDNILIKMQSEQLNVFNMV